VDIEVDQSIKVENTRRPTVLALSDEVTYALLIPARVKRRALAYLREQGKPAKIATLRVFAAGLFLLLRDFVGSVEQVTIDVEYAGHEADIRSMLLALFRKAGQEIESETITFARIGKRSRAHHLALSVGRGKRPPDQRVKADELLTLLK